MQRYTVEHLNFTR